MSKCTTSDCKNDPLGKKYCSTCRSRQCRQRDPVRYFLNNLRKSAVKRKIEFTLELEPFRNWCIKENFRFGIKKHGDRDSVDRRKNNQGYTMENIQKLKVSENSKKYQNHDKYEYKQIDPVGF